jgi:hypothetical protein
MANPLKKYGVDLQDRLREIEPVQAKTTPTAAPPASAPSYAGTYEDQLADIFDRIQNRERFSYDVNADPLYRQYKDDYIQGGRRAMQDTMGRAAALTGGYGSSYAQQVGQQTYGSYLQDLSAVIPELYGMAYDMYRDQGDDLSRQYSLLGGLRDTEYNRWRDELSDYNYQQERERQREETEYNRRINEENTDYTRRRNEEADEFNRRQTYFNNLVALIRASGYNPTDDELEQAGLSREAADALRNEYNRGINGGGSGYYGGGGGGGGDGGDGGSGGSGDSGSSGGSGSSAPEIDYASINNLGRGPISADYLSRLVESGQVSEDLVGNRIVYTNNPTPRTTGDPITDAINRIRNSPIGPDSILTRLGNSGGNAGSTGTSGNTGGTVSRGAAAREALRRYQAGEISQDQYQTIIRGLH